MFVCVAVFVLLDSLLLAPVLVVAFGWPELVWFALGPYLAISLGAVALLMYLAHRWGMLELSGPAMSGVGRLVVAICLLTAVFVAVVIVWPVLVWPAVVLYVISITYAVYRLLRWQATNLAFQCQECDKVFRGSLITWLLSPNMGTRKSITCPLCGRHSWARIVAAEDGPGVTGV